MFSRKSILGAMQEALLASRHLPAHAQMEAVLDAIEANYVTSSAEDLAKVAAMAYWDAILPHYETSIDTEWSALTKHGKEIWLAVGSALYNLCAIDRSTTKDHHE